MSYSTRAASCSSACAVASFSLPLKSSLNSVFIASPNTLKVKVYFYIISSQALMRNKLVSLKNKTHIQMHSYGWEYTYKHAQRNDDDT